MKRYLYLVIGGALLVAGFMVRAQTVAEAKRLADDIVKQDLAGANTVTAQQNLATFVQEHTGASVSYTLQGAYDRDIASAKATMAAATAANSRIYADAQKACAGKSDSVTQAKCNQDYLAKHVQPTITPVVQEPVLASYQRHLTAPAWTTDLAGALLLGSGAALALGIINVLPRRGR